MNVNFTWIDIDSSKWFINIHWSVIIIIKKVCEPTVENEYNIVQSMNVPPPPPKKLLLLYSHHPFYK